jgi:hypothetical protein
MLFHSFSNILCNDCQQIIIENKKLFKLRMGKLKLICRHTFVKKAYTKSENVANFL